MTVNLTCPNTSSSLPDIPTNLSGLSVVPKHLSYDSNGKALSQRISSALARLTFSDSDIELLLKEITENNGKIWDMSTIVQLKPVTSTIIYSSIALALFLALSLTFCIMTCCRCCQKDSTPRYKQHRKRKCSGHSVCVFGLILIGLIVVGQMIYLSIQFRRTTTHLDESIVTINQEIYPKEISDYFKGIVSQLEKLDQYTTQNNSILLNASQVIFVEAFKEVFRTIYFFDDILERTANNTERIKYLGQSINESNLTGPVQSLYQSIKNDSERLVVELQKPLDELCNYASGKDGDINEIILDGLEQVHQQLRNLIDTIENNVLNTVYEENGKLIEKSLEDQIRYYIYLVGIIFLVLIILIGIVPILFLVFTCLCRLCDRERHYTASKSLLANHCSKTGLCCARIFCFPMFLILIIIVLVTSTLYAVDLAAQGSCRTVHENQPFLISFLTDELFGANSSDSILDQSDIKTIIEDCGNHTHFTKHLLKSYLSSVNSHTARAINQLNQQIFEQFNSSIDSIDIQSNIEHVQLLKNLTDITNITVIRSTIEEIEDDLSYIEERFINITDDIPIIPIDLIDSSTLAFRNYLDRVLELTLDQCPLPLSILYKADTLVCHELAASVNGLWLSLFIYLFLITFGLCILGLCICNQTQPTSSTKPIRIVHKYSSNIF